MITNPAGSTRNMLPRWRSLSRTLESHELSNPKLPSAVGSYGHFDPDFLDKIQRSRVSPNLVHAAELLEASLVMGYEAEAVNAARRIINSKVAVDLVRKNAALVLARTGNHLDIPPDLIDGGKEDTAHIWRERTRLHPHDALAWLELALAQISSRAEPSARRNISVALSLAPQNRHILRSAARFYIHTHQNDRAHDLILRSEATPYDPWLIAAEVSTAAHAGRASRYLKHGLRLLEEKGRLPRQITELAGAAGTRTLADGDRKRGRRLMELSLADPTGNSLAQAEWVSQNYGERFQQGDQVNRLSDAKEALAIRYFRTGNFKLATKLAREWIVEERFSSRAYVCASAAAAVDEDYKAAEELASEGLKHDPTSESLLNSRIFALACLGRLEDAETLLRPLASRIGKGDMMEGVVCANQGLIAFRSGNADAGGDFYKKAIGLFARKQLREQELAARAYYAREASRAGIADAAKLVADVLTANEKFKLPHIARVIGAELIPEELQATPR